MKFSLTDPSLFKYRTTAVMAVYSVDANLFHNHHHFITEIQESQDVKMNS